MPREIQVVQAVAGMTLEKFEKQCRHGINLLAGILP